MKNVTICFLFLFVLIFSGGSVWQREIVGQYSWLYEVKIGDGRNDGVQRVYTSTFDGHVVEWTFNDGTWDIVEVGQAIGGDNRIVSIWIGDAQNDGTNRIYGGSPNGNIYEFYFSNDSWHTNIVDSPGGSFAGVTIGDSRNDGQNRLIVGGWNIPCIEYSYIPFEWVRENTSSSNRDSWPMAIGNGRNDDLYRIYSPDWAYNLLREYTWNPESLSYDEITIESPYRLVKAIVGDGRNDGIQRVYAAGMFGRIVEFSFEDGEWNYNDIQYVAPHLSRYGLCFGKLDPDSNQKLYSVAQLGSIREHSWNGEYWDDEEIDTVTGATADLTVGNGRNDGRERVYVAGSNGNLYEYTLIDTTNLATISGYITSDNQESNISEAIITINENQVNPDTEGFYSINCYEGAYNLEVSLAGHVSQNIDLVLHQSEELQQDFSLHYLTPPQDLLYSYEGNSVTLAWTFTEFENPDFSNFKVYRQVNDSNWNFVGNAYENTFTTNLVQSVTFRYYITAMYNEFESDPTNIVEVNITNNSDSLQPKPKHINLNNFPNPFNPETRITFELHAKEKISLDIFNMKGQKIKSLITNEVRVGKQNIIWNGKNDNEENVPSGIYLYRLITNSRIYEEKMILLK